MPEHAKTALIVVDVQHHVFFSDDLDTTLNNKNPQLALNHIKRAILSTEQAGHQIIYTKMIYNPETLPETITQRNKVVFANSPILSPQSPDIALYQLQPRHRDTVIIKHTYDPFLADGFLTTLQDNLITHLVICGFYLDICIDSLLRTAYQKNYTTTLLADATESQFHQQNKCYKFIQRYYHTQVISTDHYLKEKSHDNSINC